MNNNKNEERYDKNDHPKTGESTLTPPGTTTADNPSVQHQPPVEEATKSGSADKMNTDTNEDRKHTP